MVSKNNPGIDTATAALQIITGSIAKNESTFPELVASIDHLGTAPKLELIEAIAYLAAQVTAYRDASDEDARLFVTQVALMVQRYDERRAALKTQAAVGVIPL